MLDLPISTLALQTAKQPVWLTDQLKGTGINYCIDTLQFEGVGIFGSASQLV